MNLARTVALLLGCLLAALGFAGLTLQSGWLNLSVAELRQRYALPQSQYADLDGVQVHYVDEGQGPAIVLVHASYMSLRNWDALAASLKNEFRVIRYDQLGAGLTGPDPKNDYAQEHNRRILDALTRKLGVEQFALLGTSSGGITAFHYAAENPQRVTRLILVNSAGMPRTAVTDPNRPRGTALDRWIQARYRSHGYWRENLTKQFGSGMAPPDDLVQRVYDMNRRDTLRAEGAATMRAFRTGDPEAVLGKITSPTLILWGMGNITVDHLQADVFQHWLFNAPTLKKKYPKVGHYFYHEIPDEFAKDLRDFLLGARDAELLRVTRSNAAI
jgi:pimeloyl-ACP methyl ester carboxylesterase